MSQTERDKYIEAMGNLVEAVDKRLTEITTGDRELVERPTLARVPRYKITIYDEANNAEAESVMVEAAAYDTLAAQLAEYEKRPWPGCRMLSKGEACDCSLCKAERERDLLAAQLAEAKADADDLRIRLQCADDALTAELTDWKEERDALAAQRADLSRQNLDLRRDMARLEAIEDVSDERDTLAAQLTRVEMERDGMVAPEELAQWKYERDALAAELQQVKAERDALKAKYQRSSMD